MAEFVRPVLDNVMAILQKYTPELLKAKNRDQIAEWGLAFTGIIINPPAVYVMPRSTEFDPEGSGRHQGHTITVKFAVMHGDKEELAALALDYMWAIDGAITAAGSSDWNEGVLRVFVQRHDYGPLYERGNVLARFPELHLIIETMEVDG